MLLGASYTITPTARMAKPRMYDSFFRTYYPAVPGIYRCDTYLMDAFQYSSLWNGSGYDSFARIGYPVDVQMITPEPQDWKDKIAGMMRAPVWTPVQLYNRLKTF